MFERRRAIKQAGHQRDALEPIARKLGVDLTYSMVEPPVTTEARVLDAYRVGQQVLADFKDPNAWPMPDEYRVTGRTSELARRAAKSAQQRLASEDSFDAISWMTQGYGRVMAAAWRRRSKRDDVNHESARLFNLNAEVSEELALRAAEYWPVQDTASRLAFVESAQHGGEAGGIDPDNADGTVDVQLYYAEAAATCGALALLLGDQLDDELLTVLAEAVESYDLFFSSQLMSIWNASGDSWINLFASDPYPWIQMLEFANTGVSPFVE